MVQMWMVPIWKIELWKSQWTEIDHKKQSSELNAGNVTRTFDVLRKEKFRFIRLVNIGRNWEGDDQLRISAWEIFGILIEYGRNRWPLMYIRMKCLWGQLWVFGVDPSARVEDLKKMICNREGSPPNQQRLIFHGRELENGRHLQDYGLKNGSTVILILRLQGLSF